MEKILAKFNEMTDNEFDYIKLSSVNVNVRKKTCDFNFIYPAAKEGRITAKREFVENTFKRLIRSTADVHIKLKKSHFDFDFFKADFFAFLSTYPTLSNTLADKDVVCVSDESGNPVIRLRLQQSVYDYCVAQNLRASMEDFLSVNFCEEIGIELLSTGTTEIDVKAPVTPASTYVLDRPEEGRLIRPQNVEEFIGKIIYEPAGYIEDITAPKEVAVLCGTVSRIYEQARKPKEGQEQSDRKFFKFVLEDYTGSVSCVYFPTKKTVEQFSLLTQGRQIVARGKIEEDTYRGGGAKSFLVRDISLCTLPETFAPNRMRRRVPDAYSVVFPEKHVESAQSSLFDGIAATKSIPSFVRGKTFCVFDIETTGFNPDSNKIIEIGAVKVVDGLVTETFSTFINPDELLPEKIIKLTHIEDKDLVGQPHVDEVLIDFYKFTDGAILVGQNVQFDVGFIRAYGAPLNIYFDNQLMDTLSLAKTYIPGLHNYKLGTIAKHFNIVNRGAHRAIYDAWATMEVFMKMAEKLN